MTSDFSNVTSYFLFFQIKAGSIINIICCVLLVIAINTYGYLQFGLGELPTWALDKMAEKANATIIAAVNGTVDPTAAYSFGN